MTCHSRKRQDHYNCKYICIFKLKIQSLTCFGESDAKDALLSAASRFNAATQRDRFRKINPPRGRGFGHDLVVIIMNIHDSLK